MPRRGVGRGPTARRPSWRTDPSTWRSSHNHRAATRASPATTPAWCRGRLTAVARRCARSADVRRAMRGSPASRVQTRCRWSAVACRSLSPAHLSTNSPATFRRSSTNAGSHLTRKSARGSRSPRTRRRRRFSLHPDDRRRPAPGARRPARGESCGLAGMAARHSRGRHRVAVRESSPDETDMRGGHHPESRPVPGDPVRRRQQRGRRQFLPVRVTPADPARGVERLCGRVEVDDACRGCARNPVQVDGDRVVVVCDGQATIGQLERTMVGRSVQRLRRGLEACTRRLHRRRFSTALAVRWTA